MQYKVSSRHIYSMVTLLFKMHAGAMQVPLNAMQVPLNKCPLSQLLHLERPQMCITTIVVELLLLANVGVLHHVTHSVCLRVRCIRCITV
jgi:hypothetical protein